MSDALQRRLRPMRPSGLSGRFFAFTMKQLGKPNREWVVAALKSTAPRRYLEIGFGPGKLAESVAEALSPELIAGIDPSDLMLQMAAKRLRRFEPGIRIELRCQDDNALPDGRFDAIVASHCFQFWFDPIRTLTRLRNLLADEGRLVLVIRPRLPNETWSWLPNPISRSGHELDGLRQALCACGLDILLEETLRSGSRGFVVAAKGATG